MNKTKTIFTYKQYIVWLTIWLIISWTLSYADEWLIWKLFFLENWA